MESKDTNFENVKIGAEELYKKFDSVVCPYFGEDVAFNAKGLKHIKFKANTVARARADQFMRLKHIKFAPRILEKSNTLQEYKEAKEFEEVKSGKKRERRLQLVRYYGFISIVESASSKKRFKIIVRQVGDGERYFWSIVPFWKRNKDIKIHSGDLEED